MAERRFEDQVALVVGGAQGIGKAIAVRLGREGAHVAIADIDGSMIDAAAAEIPGARAFRTDVRNGDQVRQMVRDVAAWHDRIDVLMYVAGVAPAAPFLELTEKDWDNTLDTNLRGAFLVSQAVAPHMAARRRGKLVFMASTNAWDGEAQLAHYNASKAGVFLLAKTLARELGPLGIQSNAVGPGFIRTRLTEAVLHDEEFLKKYDPAHGLIPAGRIGEPNDVAGPALFLASSDADYVSGVLLFVDGGQLA
jgi:NAD(P)-dependent dehydrogenase (short-subunit alcohol dehydrogenase family)